MKKRKRSKSHLKRKYHFLLPFLCLLIIAAVFGVPREFRANHISPKSVHDSIASPPPSFSPYPSPYPPQSSQDSISPTVETGFCLNVPVIFYHHIEPPGQAKTEGHLQLTVDNQNFEKQMAYLNAAGYNTISLAKLAQAIAAHQKLGGKNIVVSIDDGYQDLFTYAFPIITKYHITTSLAIATGLVNNAGYINWDQLKQMVGSGQVTAYDHTWSHASLPALSQSRALYEITTGKSQIEANLGQPTNVFIYPYGTVSDQVTTLLKSSGFIAAFSTTGGFTQCDSNIFSLHRTRIGNSPLSSYGL